jgi:deoxyribonuclease-4
MYYIGAHISIAGGVEHAPLNANEISANAFAMFTKNQKQWSAKPITEYQKTTFIERCGKYNFLPEQILPHDSYLINLGSPDNEKLNQARAAFLEELLRCELLGLIYLNFHPGSHLHKITEKDCLKRIGESLNIAISKTKNAIPVIENTAGQGSNVGYRFEHLAQIIEYVEDKNRIGVCIDTCHAFAAGYDWRDILSYQKTWDEFNKIIGFKYLKALHLNDSKSEFKSKIDRHASLNKGNIGLQPFVWIMQDCRLENIPMILETPDSALWKDEIALLKSFCFNTEE